MTKILRVITIIVCALSMQISFGMQQEGAATLSGDEAYFSKYQVAIPLKLSNKPLIQKDAFLSMPTSLVKAKAHPAKDTNIPTGISGAVVDTLLAAHETQGREEMEQALHVCTQLMFANDKGWFFPNNAPLFQYINPELFKLMQVKQTYFVFNRSTKMLLLRWHLGEYENGWAFDQVIEVQHIPEHPRKGTCSDMLVYYYGDKLAGKVLLSTLREQYAQAKKQTVLTSQNIQKMCQKHTEDEINSMQTADVVAMAMHYVSNPDNLKDAKKTDTCTQ